MKRAKGAPKSQKTESQRVKSRKKRNSIELRGKMKRVGTIKNISYFEPTTDQRKEIERKLAETSMLTPGNPDRSSTNGKCSTNPLYLKIVE